MDGTDIAAAILADAERIAREKNGKALTVAEANTPKAADFLAKVIGPVEDITARTPQQQPTLTATILDLPNIRA